MTSRFDIRNRLKKHREHFRALPKNASDELNAIIDEVDAESELLRQASKPVKKVSKKRDLGKGTKKVTKKS
jgi:hypothetical protein